MTLVLLVTLLLHVTFSSFNDIINCFLSGLRAEDSPTWHYQMTNSSLCWKVGKSLLCNDKMWLLNSKVIVLNKNVTTNYTHRMDFNSRNCSLCVHKLSKRDSGLYKLLVVENDYKTKEETHKLLVEGKSFIFSCCMGLLGF